MPFGFTGAMILGGSALSAFGNVSANRAQAEAERANASFYLEQEAHIESAGLRQIELLEEEGEQVFSHQISSFGAAGVDISGSALLSLVDTKEGIRKEKAALQEETEFRMRMARLRAQSAESKADDLSSFKTNFLQTAGTLMGGGIESGLFDEVRFGGGTGRQGVQMSDPVMAPASTGSSIGGIA